MYKEQRDQVLKRLHSAAMGEDDISPVELQAAKAFLNATSETQGGYESKKEKASLKAAEQSQNDLVWDMRCVKN